MDGVRAHAAVGSTAPAALALIVGFAALVLGLVALSLVGLYVGRNRLIMWKRADLEARVRRETGREVVLHALELDAACHTLSVRATVPLAPGWTLEVERARIGNLLALARGGAPVLEDAAGRLTGERDGFEVSAPLEFRARDAGAAGPLLRGGLRSPGIRVQRAGQPALPPLDVDAQVEVGAAGWKLSPLRLAVGGAAAEGELAGAPGGSWPHGNLHVEGVNRDLVGALMAVLPRTRAWMGTLPADFVASGQAELEPDRAWSARVELAAGGSQLALRAQVSSDGTLADARVTGKLASATLEGAPGFALPAGLRLAEPVELTVDARGTGPLAALRWAITLFAPSVRLHARAATVALAPLTARLRWEAAGEPAFESLEGPLELGSAAGLLSGAFAVVSRGVPLEGHWLRAVVTLAGARFAPRMAPAFEGIDANCVLELRPGAWQLSGLRVTWGAAVVEGTATGLADGSLVPPLAVKLEGLEAKALAALARLAPAAPVIRVMRPDAPPGGFPVPPDLRVSGQLGLGPDGAPVCTLVLDTDTSRLFFAGRPAGDAPRGWKLSGRLSARDVNVMQWWTPLVLAADAEMFLEMAVRRDLVLAGTAAAPALTAKAFGDTPFAPPIPFTDIAAKLEVTGDALIWEDLTGRVWGGTVTCAGRMRFDADPFPYTCRVDWTDLSTGQTPFANQLRAAASGHLAFEGRGSDLGTFTGEGAVTLAEPRYLFLARLAPQLSTYGLPAPPAGGSGPGRVLVSIGERSARLRQLELRVPGVEVGGAVTIGFDGTLSGALQVDLAQQYLAQSALLALPAAVTKSVRIPATLSGTLSAPEYQLDLAGTLGHLMKNYSFGDLTRGLANNYELGSLTRGLVDGFNQLTGGGRRDSGAGLPVGPELDRMLGRILANAPDASQLMDRLAAAGLSDSDLRRLLADYRRRTS